MSSTDRPPILTTPQRAHTSRRPVPQQDTSENHWDRKLLKKETLPKSVTTVQVGSYSKQGWQTVTTQGNGPVEETSVSTEDDTDVPFSELRQITVVRLRLTIFFILINLSIIFSISRLNRDKCPKSCQNAVSI